MIEVQRQSNFELLRVIAMVLIVTHHYAANSTVMDQFVQGGNSINHIFLKLIGAWGKTAINPFVMMSGFFMCTSTLTARRFLKIFLEWMFYAFLIYGVLRQRWIERPFFNRYLKA